MCHIQFQEITQHPTETFEFSRRCCSCLPPLPPSLLTHDDRPPTDTGGGGLFVGETSAAGVLAAHDLPRKGRTWMLEGRWGLLGEEGGEAEAEEAEQGRQLWRSAGVVPVFLAGEGLAPATLKKARSCALEALSSLPSAAASPAAASFSPTAGSGVDQHGVRGRAEEMEEGEEEEAAAAWGSEGVAAPAAAAVAAAAAAGAAGAAEEEEEEALLARSGVRRAASATAPGAGGRASEKGCGGGG